MKVEGGLQDENDDSNDDGEGEVERGKFAVKAVVNGKKADNYCEDEGGDEDGPAENVCGGGVEGGTKRHEGYCGAEFGEKFGGADFGFAFATLPF